MLWRDLLDFRMIVLERRFFYFFGCVVGERERERGRNTPVEDLSFEPSCAGRCLRVPYP